MSKQDVQIGINRAETFAERWERLMRAHINNDTIYRPKVLFQTSGSNIWLGSACSPEPAIPPLDVPQAPAEPEPAVEPPESASVQMLRKLLADRRRELADVKESRTEDLEDIADLEQQLAGLRKDVEQHDRHITAAEIAIAQALADIATLGGRPEPEA